MPNSLITVVIPVKDEDQEIVDKLIGSLKVYNYAYIIVDDGSKIPVKGAAIRHPVSLGYGKSIKDGVQKASSDLVATMDGDGQHNVWDIKRLEDFFLYFHDNRKETRLCGYRNPDMVVGNRRLREKTIKRFLGRKMLNWMASLFAGKFLPDLNSGMRIFKREIAISYEPILCDGFSYTTSLTLAMCADGYYVDWLPIKVWPRTKGESKVRLFRDGWVTLRTILWIGLALRTRKIREWLRSLR